MTIELGSIVRDFAAAMVRADAARPRSKRWQPGLGPHDEKDLIRLVIKEMAHTDATYAKHRFEVAYPSGDRDCDLCFGDPTIEWAIEVKALRMLGDNGQPAIGRDDVSKILSPYTGGHGHPSQHSALTDCSKIVSFTTAKKRAILIYAWDFVDFPMALVIDAFELLANRVVQLGAREVAAFDGLIHPIHQRGAVFAWNVLGLR